MSFNLIFSITAMGFVLFSSCKKDNGNDSPDPKAEMQHPFLTVGNVWVYESVLVDSSKEHFEKRLMRYHVQ